MAAILEMPVTTTRENFNLSEEAIQNLNRMGVEWKGRMIQEVYDEFSLKVIVKAAAIYLKHLEDSPHRGRKSNKAIIDLMQKMFDQNGIPPYPEHSPYLRRYDPVSGCYHVLIATDCVREKKMSQRNQAIAKRLDEILQSKGFKTLILES